MQAINETEAARYHRIHAEGYAAFRGDKSNLYNPYTDDDGECEAWNDGWLLAEENCMNDYDNNRY